MLENIIRKQEINRLYLSNMGHSTYNGRYNAENAALLVKKMAILKRKNIHKKVEKLTIILQKKAGLSILNAWQ